MGWKNMFIDINPDSKDYCPLSKVEEFVNHHNNFTEYFSKEELDRMSETDELPGEELNFKILIQNVTGKDRYWAYLGNFGGAGHTFDWKDKYFPKVKMFSSDTFEFYSDGWTKWPIKTLEEFKLLSGNNE